MRLKMARIQMVGLKPRLVATVHTLHGLGCVQIEDLSETSDVSARPLHLDRDTLRAQEELGYLVAKIEGLSSVLSASRGGARAAATDAPRAESGTPERDCQTEARTGLEALSPQVQALVSKRESLEAERASLPRYEATLRKLLPIVPASARDPANASVGMLVSRAHLAVLDAIAERVVNLSGGRAEVVAEDVDAATRAMLLVFPREFAAEVEALLGREDISRLRLPEAFAALTRLGETDQTFVLVGWTPERAAPRVRKALAAEVGETVVMQML